MKFCLIVFLFLMLTATGSTQNAMVDVRGYGAKCDGTTNDTTAFNNAIAALSASTSPARTLIIPSGICRANIVITEVKGIKLLGSGSRIGTTIRGIGSSPALAANGLWYSQFEGITFDTENAQSGKGVVEIDGNYDGTHHQGVQGNTFKDCYFAGAGLNSGGLSDYAFTMTRQGGSSGQGSENLFLNCHFSGAENACYYQNGFNALNNTFIGGNFQTYKKNGIQIIAGSIQVFSVAFQSTYKYVQVANGGWDIDASTSGVGETINVSGCRTESLRFYNGGGSQTAIVSGNSQNVLVDIWAANTAFALDQIVVGNGRYFRVTTAGTSSGTQPSWPASGTIGDGTITWTQTPISGITVVSGEISRSNSFFPSGIGGRRVGEGNAIEVTSSDYTALRADGVIYVDTSGGARTITISGLLPSASSAGQRLLIKRHGTDANNVTISFFTDTCGTSNLILPGGTLDAAEFVGTGGGALCTGMRLVGYYEDRTKTVVTAGTTSAQTINDYLFRVNLAASDTSKVVNNSLITASSIVICTVATNDTTMKSVAAVPGSGSVTLYPNAAPTAETSVSCTVK